MRYIADIIPSKAKVLPDYFKGNAENLRTIPIPAKVLYYFLAVIFLLFALSMVLHPLLALLSAIMGAGMLPSVHRWLEKKLQFVFTPGFKLLIYGVLLIPFMILSGHYTAVDLKLAQERAVQEQQLEREQAIAAAKDSVRRDSLYSLLSTLKTQRQHSELTDKEAQETLEHLSLLAVNPAERKDIAAVRFEIDGDRSQKLINQGQYKQALQLLDSLLPYSPHNTTLLYNHALCYDKLGQPEEAVKELRLAINEGSKEAEQLHNKINPEQRRVIGYVTRCCDGSTSNAKGRGACSWHGGVCNWNDPIYETYRKYE